VYAFTTLGKVDPFFSQLLRSPFVRMTEYLLPPTAPSPTVIDIDLWFVAFACVCVGLFRFNRICFIARQRLRENRGMFSSHSSHIILTFVFLDYRVLNLLLGADVN
jgi:hypothetical protein